MTKKDSEIKIQPEGNDRNKLFDDLLNLEDRKFLLMHGKVREAT
jgi:hypothetical protein